VNNPRLVLEERLRGALQDAMAGEPRHTMEESATTDRITLQPPLPPQTPQSSMLLPLLGTPSQPVHVALLPPHTPQESRFAWL
jgi:hypothetical protein